MLEWKAHYDQFNNYQRKPSIDVGGINEEKQRGEEVDGIRIKGQFFKGRDSQSTSRTRTRLVTSASPQPAGE